MGIFYSHIVFQPPSPPSYADHNGIMTFRKVRQEYADDSDDEDVSRAERVEQALPEEAQYVNHPIFYLTTSKGNTIPAAYFHQPDSYYTILFSHGNGEDLGVTASYALELSNALKTSVLCYDYSGYGLATGKPSESNCYADIRAAYAYLLTERRVLARRILLFGRSLGSGPTLDLAMSLGTQLGGVVLIAALTSCVRVVFNHAPHTLKFDMFANIDKIDKVAVPVFCVHGMVDDVVPFDHGLTLSRKARFPLEPLWIRGAGHNNLESSRFQYEVFLRYMKVLQEFKRWKMPEDGRANAATPTKKRESIGALVSCFGPQRTKSEEDVVVKGRGRRVVRSPNASSGSLVLNRRFGSSHEMDLKMMWNEEEQSVLTRRSSEATFGSRNLFEQREERVLVRTASKQSVSSVVGSVNSVQASVASVAGSVNSMPQITAV